MLWRSIVSYFADSTRLAAIYAVIDDINKTCQKNVLFNYSTKLGYYDESNDHNVNKEHSKDYSNSIQNITININDFTSDRNYFTISYIFGAHLILILSTAGVSLHLLPISFYLINKKTTCVFKEWNLLSYSSIY